MNKCCNKPLTTMEVGMHTMSGEISPHPRALSRATKGRTRLNCVIISRRYKKTTFLRSYAHTYSHASSLSIHFFTPFMIHHRNKPSSSFLHMIIKRKQQTRRVYSLVYKKSTATYIDLEAKKAPARLQVVTSRTAHERFSDRTPIAFFC